MGSKLSNFYKGSWTIYSLVDPRTDKVRYVGCTTDVADRFNIHILHCRRVDSACTRWLVELLDLQLLPKLQLLEEGSGAGFMLREAYWIQQFKAAGEDLTNKIIKGVERDAVPNGTLYSLEDEEEVIVLADPTS